MLLRKKAVILIINQFYKVITYKKDRALFIT